MNASQSPVFRHDDSAELAELIKTVPAAWPHSGSGLARTISACSTCPAHEVCRDWLAHAPDRIHQVPPFCPNAKLSGLGTGGQSRRPT